MKGVQIRRFKDRVANCLDFGYSVFIREKVYNPTGSRLCGQWEVYVSGTVTSPLDTIKCIKTAVAWIVKHQGELP